jgi:hypothetical protein
VGGLDAPLGKPQYDSLAFRELFAKSCAINLIAAARIFMLGLRDVWFVVGLPVFLYAEGWRYMQVAGFLAAWTIGCGLAQALAPNVIRRSADGLSREVPEARLWGTILTAIPVALAVLVTTHPSIRLDLAVVIGLGIFGLLSPLFPRCTPI